MNLQSFFRLDGKVAFVTGAGQGIGEAIARRLASAGAKVGVFDRNAAALMGINVNGIFALSFGLAAALGGAAGILIAPVTQASATMGLILGLKGFAVAIIGGITSAPGVVIAGLGFGVLEKFVEGYISTAAREIIGFSATILILLIFPQGLFGKREVFKV